MLNCIVQGPASSSTSHVSSMVAQLKKSALTNAASLSLSTQKTSLKIITQDVRVIWLFMFLLDLFD